ncbi:unnamed protein product [Acanthoscelides obtectus]|uniref:Uncharacterized protein n=1 Tax=Acanthoscelides obtectus TaxID=200917 RepID=A0A9P0JXW7_ACAOB|nr:unnamed protein product [Acanthoscelides obtectus]CAK1663482.1 hypothetical protein AOBTE_LOCUS23698 [Acanthoscelides obtectus]
MADDLYSLLTATATPPHFLKFTAEIDQICKLNNYREKPRNH